jgi:hypothetical protein
MPLQLTGTWEQAVLTATAHAAAADAARGYTLRGQERHIFKALERVGE